LLTKVSGTNYDTTWTTVIPGDRYLTSSVTSNTISNGNKTFTIGTGLSYTPTQNLTISFDASNHMHGEVLTYNSGTGVLTVDINHHTGTGTYTSWVVNVGGVTPATSVAWGGITGTLSTQTDLQTALDDRLALAGGTMDAAATIVLSTATYNSLVSGEVFGVELTADPAQNASLGFSGLTVQDGSGTTLVTPAGISFPDFTTQTTAAVTFTGGTLSSVVAVSGSGGTSTLGDSSGGSITVTDLGATSTISITPTAILFPDSTSQTTAAIAPPNADVYKANAIISNINYFYGSSGTWVGGNNPVPTVAASASWGVYNPTDGYIAYSYTSGTTFYLASATTTNANLSVQVSGSNSSFYIN
jgi:hypothetical protein